MYQKGFYRHTLENGLRILVSEKTSCSSVALSIQYGVGYRSEEEGQSGLAHLFEHLMFQGSANFAKNSHFRIVQGCGGETGGVTKPDVTDYYQVVPTEHLRTALELEADRMHNPTFGERELAIQTDVIKQEIRSHSQNPYYGFPRNYLSRILYRDFGNCHNGYSDINSLGDIHIEECWNFFKNFYAPNNAVLAIVGNTSADEVVKMAEEYFSGIPRSNTIQSYEAVESDPRSRREVRLESLHAHYPAVALGYRTPNPSDIDKYLSLVVAGAFLGDGARSALRRHLIGKKRMASAVSVGCGFGEGPFTMRDPDTFTIMVLHSSVTDARIIRAEIDSVLDYHAESGISEEDSFRAVKRASTRFYRQCDTLLSQAKYAASFELITGRAELLWELTQRMDNVSNEDITRAIQDLSLARNERAELTLTTNGADIKDSPQNDSRK